MRERAILYLLYETFISFPKGLLHNLCRYLHHMTNRENTKLLAAIMMRFCVCETEV